MNNARTSLIKILLGIPFIAGCLASAQADVVFHYGSTGYVSSDANFQNKATESGSGPYVFTRSFSDTGALSPFSGYSGPVFYGGYDFSSSTINPESGISRQQVRNNYAGADQIYLKCTNYPDGWAGSDLSLHAMFLFKQESFNPGFTAGDIGVDSFSVSWGSVNVSETFDLTGYFSVQIDGVYYLSQTTFNMSTDGSFSLSDLSSEQWAVFDPESSLDFDQGSAVYTSLALENVTAVGVYFEDDVWEGGEYDAAFDLGIKSFEVSGTTIPEPAHMSILLGVVCLIGLRRFRALSRRRR